MNTCSMQVHECLEMDAHFKGLAFDREAPTYTVLYRDMQLRSRVLQNDFWFASTPRNDSGRAATTKKSWFHDCWAVITKASCDALPRQEHDHSCVVIKVLVLPRHKDHDSWAARITANTALCCFNVTSIDIWSAKRIETQRDDVIGSQ